jgi:hypothetical protein
MKNLFMMIVLLVAGSPLWSFANPDSLGQTIQIYTQLRAFVGKPTWLLVIRDVDHGQNIPYVYDFKRGDNFWMALTYGRNYLIVASTLVFNPYEKLKTNNFCNLESNGRIIRGDSLYITINGYLSPNTNTYTCNVSRYTDTNFNIAPSN